MDAMPVTMGQELQVWASKIAGNHHRLAQALAQLMHIPQGGTAVGTGINANPDFATLFAQKLSDNTGLEFASCDNFFAAICSQVVVVSTSGQLKTLAARML